MSIKLQQKLMDLWFEGLEVSKEIQKLENQKDEMTNAQQRDYEKRLRELSLEFNCLVNFVGFNET